MPAEWEPHEATWLAYPQNASDWPGKLNSARWAHLEIIRHLQRNETVRLIVPEEKPWSQARSILQRNGVNIDDLEVHFCASNRNWLRDSGPTFVRQGQKLHAVCWLFNAWAKYKDWQKDARVGRFIARRAGAEIIEPKINGQVVCMEGGAIDCNGHGTLLTTEQCLLSEGPQTRNPCCTRDEIESVLGKTLGVQQILWLSRGITGDDTGGHIDNLARFAGSNRVVTIVETDSRDVNHAPLLENLRRLRGMHAEDGKPLEIVELPMPRPVFYNSCRLPASYANFYIANNLVLVPTFNDPNDRVALRILEQCFPDREVCGIHSLDLLLGLGTLHCQTQQQPAI